MPSGNLFIRRSQGYLLMYHRYPQSCDIPVFCSQVLRDHLQWWTNFSSLKESPLLHQEEHNLLLFLDVFFKGWDVQLWHQTASGLWYYEESRLHINRVTSFRIIRKSDSDSKSVDFHRQFISGSYLNKQEGSHFQECVPLSEESYLGRMPGGFRFGHITSQGIQIF